MDGSKFGEWLEENWDDIVNDYEYEVTELFRQYRSTEDEGFLKAIKNFDRFVEDYAEMKEAEAIDREVDVFKEMGFDQKAQDKFMKENDWRRNA
jgi:hypothetical protein